MTPVDFQEPVDLVTFHSEADKLERAVAAYESVLVKRGQPIRETGDSFFKWGADSAEAMKAALKEYARMSPLLPTFIVQND